MVIQATLLSSATSITSTKPNLYVKPTTHHKHIPSSTANTITKCTITTAIQQPKEAIVDQYIEREREREREREMSGPTQLENKLGTHKNTKQLPELRDFMVQIRDAQEMEWEFLQEISDNQHTFFFNLFSKQ